MKKDWLPCWLTGALITIIVLIFLLVTPPQKLLIEWIALGFLILGVLLASILLTKLGGTAFTNLAFGSVSAIYILINLTMAFLSKSIFWGQPLRYVILQLLLLAVAALVCAPLIRFSQRQAAAKQKNGSNGTS